MSIHLSDMMLAREIERQRVELHIYTDASIDADLERGRKVIESGGPDDLDTLLAVMRRHRDQLDVEGWLDAFGALFWVASDEQIAEWKILDAVLGRLFSRLLDRMTGGATRESLARRAAGVVEMAGATIAGYAESSGYKPTPGVGDLAWRTARTTQLGDDAGPDEEREAYEREAFDPADRAAFDYYFARKMPPLGMCFTTACIAADLIARYGARSGLDRLDAIRAASDVVELAAGRPASKEGAR